MANSRYKFFDTIWNEEEEYFQKGLMTLDIKDLLITDKDIYYKIPQEFQYRPDLIAKKFYGNHKLYWVLIYTNDFNNSPQDFDTDIIIRIPNINRVMDVIG